MDQTVGKSEMKVSGHSGDVLVTYFLGSCVGVAAYDPVARVGGMIHCMLPLSRMNRQMAQRNPAMFVDTGTHALFEALFSRGAEKGRMIVKIAGASQMIDDGEIFKIGERNYAVLRKILWQNNILVDAEDVGGAAPRTMYLEIGTGRVTIRSRGNITELSRRHVGAYHMAYNILVVDDSRTTRAVIAETLNLAGVPVQQLYQVDNGKDALKVLDGNWIDLVMTDINMPVMDGVELVNRMLSQGLLQAIPVVIISSDGSKTRIEQMMSKGVRACVRKPFTPEAIRSLLEGILGDQDGN